MDQKWHKYRKDGIPMGCGCGAKKPAKAPKVLGSSGNFQDNQATAIQTIQTENGQMVMLEYQGPIEEPFTIRSRAVPGISYRFANNPNHKRKAVFLNDAEYLTGLIGPDDRPQYQIVMAGSSTNSGDPSAFLGAPVQV